MDKYIHQGGVMPARGLDPYATKWLTELSDRMVLTDGQVMSLIENRDAIRALLTVLPALPESLRYTLTITHGSIITE